MADFLDHSANRLKSEHTRRSSELKKKAEEERKKLAVLESRNKELQQKAEEDRIKRLEQTQLKEAEALRNAELGGGIDYCLRLNSISSLDEGDKVILPPSCLSFLEMNGAEFPLFFRITVINSDHSGRRTHAGVLEFTAEEGCVILPKKVRRCLQISSESSVSVDVRYVRLPKGQRAVLRPTSRSFYRIPNSKHTLEMELRSNCAAFSVGDVLSITHDQKEYFLEVLEVSPETEISAVSVIDTDIAVDIVEPSLAVRDVRRTDSGADAFVSIEVGSTLTAGISAGDVLVYRVGISDMVREIVRSGQAKIIIGVEFAAEDQDVNCYVGTGHNQQPNEIDHDFADETFGSREIVFPSSDSTSEYFIAFVGVSSRSSFDISVKLENIEVAVETAAVAGKSADSQNRVCKFCQLAVPEASLFLHEAHCARHLEKCECGMMKRRGGSDHCHCLVSGCNFVSTERQLQKHNGYAHRVTTCVCGFEAEIFRVILHRRTVCPARRLICRFCNQIVRGGGPADQLAEAAQGLTQHESSCGSRTAPCEICQRSVRLKEMEMHVQAFHKALPPAAAVAPTARIEDVPEGSECPLCSVFVQGGERAMSRHFEAAHSGEGETSGSAGSSSAMEIDTPQDPIKYECPICGHVALSERGLGIHVDEDHRA